MKCSAMAVGILTIVCTTGLMAQALAATPTSPWVGNWKLNLEKSRFNPGPTPRMQARRYELRPDGFFGALFSGVDARGTPTFLSMVFKFDGQDYRQDTQTTLPETEATGAKPGAGAYQPVGPTSFLFIQKDSKGLTINPDVVTSDSVSADGKTLTRTQTGKTAQGLVLDNLIIFDKQ